MNIAKLSINASNIQTTADIGVALLDKTIETNEIMGTAMVNMMTKSMMETSVYPNLGSNLDLYV